MTGLKDADNLDSEFIQSELGELLRMAASINDGYGSATFLLKRFGSAARNSKLHRAGTQWGQWWDSVYLCDYAAQPPFRRSVNRILVRGESVHQLERVIHDGPTHQFSEDLSFSSGALSGPPPTLSASNAGRRSEMSYPQETVTFGTFG